MAKTRKAKETGTKKKDESLKDICPKLPRDELLRRLKVLSTFLSEFDQDGDVSAISQFSEQLAKPEILNHKDKDVKLSTACCLADVLRIYAPDAPYAQAQLKAV
eukprot:Sdes_comp24496_c0_seq1m22393